MAGGVFGDGLVCCGIQVDVVGVVVQLCSSLALRQASLNARPPELLQDRGCSRHT